MKTHHNTHRREDVVLAGNGPVLLQSISHPGAMHGLAAEQAVLLQAVLEHEQATGRTARRQRRQTGNVWRRLRARFVHSFA